MRQTARRPVEGAPRTGDQCDDGLAVMGRPVVTETVAPASIDQ